MNRNYLQLASVDKEAFKASTAEDQHLHPMVETPQEDIRKIENLLDLQPGLLGNSGFLCSETTCDNCDRKLTWYDVVFTTLVEQWHDPSFIVHSFLGRKFLTGRPNNIRCTNCGTKSERVPPQFPYYDLPQYGCCWDLPKK